MVKWLVFVFLGLFSGLCQADCIEEIFSFIDEKVTISMGYAEGCYQGELELRYGFFGKNKSADGIPEEYNVVSFQQECPSQKFDGEFITEFTCRVDGESPLAGAKFKAESFADTLECEGVKYPVEKTMYVCVSGCSAQTPKKMILPSSGGTC